MKDRRKEKESERARETICDAVGTVCLGPQRETDTTYKKMEERNEDERHGEKEREREIRQRKKK